MSGAPSLQQTERLAPHNAEAEGQLLGAILVNNRLFHQVADILEPKRFFVPAHQEIYEKISILIRDDKTASPITLKSFFPVDARIAGLPVTQFLLRIAGDAATAINAEDYARLIRDLAVRRDIITLCAASTDTAFEQAIDTPPDQIIDQMANQLFELRPPEDAEGRSLASAFERIDAKITATLDGTAAPVPKTGLPEVDNDLGGLQPTNLILAAGRPGMGKTIAGVHLARRISRQGFGVGVFTLELSTEQWGARLVASEAAMGHVDLPYGKITSNDLTAEQFEAYKKYRDAANRLPIDVDDTAGLTVAQIETRTRRMAARFERQGKTLGAIIIDYIGFLKASDRYKGNKVQEVSEISSGLKALAKRMDIAVIALSQLNRGVESRDNKRPGLADLRDSGSLEQDADQVIFLYRPNYYDLKDPRFNSDHDFISEAERRANDLEWIIAKNRTGPVRPHTAFVDVSKSYIAAKSHRS